jgi:hypothetical protein
MAINGDPASLPIKVVAIKVVRLPAGEQEVFLKQPANVAEERRAIKSLAGFNHHRCRAFSNFWGKLFAGDIDINAEANDKMP